MKLLFRLAACGRSAMLMGFDWNALVGFDIGIGGGFHRNTQAAKTHALHGLQQKAAQKGGKTGFSSVNFTGELQITDPDKFR